MATKLTISVLKLRAGDSFYIKSNTASPNWNSQINIVATNPDMLEAQDTSGIVPASEEWIAAVENLVVPLQDVPFFNSVSYDIAKDKTLITINSSEQIETDKFFKSVANGTELEFISYIDADGAKIDATSGHAQSVYFGSLLVPNITVTSITHELNEFTGLTDETYIRGNPINEIKTEIFFTTKENLAGKQVEFSYGLLQNTTNPYTGSTTTVSEPYKIGPDYFTNRLTGTIQTYRGEFASPSNPLTPVNWDTGSFTIVNVVNNDYKATHIHRLLDLGTDNVSDDATDIFTPSVLDGKKSIKYVFEVVVYPDNISSMVDETTAKEDLTLFMNQGAIGWFDQVYNSPTKQYTLNSFTWDTPSGELNPAFNSVGDAVVAIDTGTWNAADQVIIAIQSIIEEDEYAVNVNLSNNIQFENVVLVADGTPVSGTNLINVSATIDAGDSTLLNISLEVVDSNYTDRYSVTAQILSNSLTSTISLKSGTVLTAADESVITFGTYPSAALTEYNFNFHWNKNISEAFNQVIAFTEDNYIARWRVVNSDTSNTSLSRFRIRIMNRETNIQYESLSISASDMPSYTQERDFLIDDPSETEYVEIIVTDNLDGTYDFQYPFQIWKSWFQEANMVFRIECRFDQILATGETVTFTNTFDSPDFQMGNYDTTLNTSLEPQALRKPPSIQFQDEATGDPLTIIKNEGLTRVIATFEDNNLNDLQVFPAAPYIYTTVIQNGLTGYLSINDKTGAQSKELQFHNFRVNQTTVGTVSNPWQVADAHPTYNSRVTRTDIKTATIEAILNAEKLKALFGDDLQCVKVSGRLDAYRIPEVCFSYMTDGVVDAVTSYSATLSGSEVPTWSFVSGDSIAVNVLNLIDRTNPISLNALDFNGNDQIVKACMTDYSTVTLLQFNETSILGTFDIELFTGVIDISIVDNPDLLDIKFPTHAIATTGIVITDNDLLSDLDLTPLSSIAGNLSVERNTSLATAIIPSSTELITQCVFEVLDSIVSLDLTGLSRLSGIFRIGGNDLMTTLSIPASTDLFSLVQIHQNDIISVIDISGFSKLGGSLLINVNVGCTSLLLPTSSESITVTNITSNTSLPSVSLLNLTNISGSVEISLNTVLTTITWPLSSGNITNINIFNNALTSLLFPSTLTISGILVAKNMPTLTSITLPPGTGVHTSITLIGTSITSFDISPRTGNNSNIAIDLNSTDLLQPAVDNVLNELAINKPTWLNGWLRIDVNGGVTPSAAGLVNVGILTAPGRGWTVIHN